MSKEHTLKGGSSPYVPPCVDVLEVQVELGFSASTEAGGNGADWKPEDGEWD